MQLEDYFDFLAPKSYSPERDARWHRDYYYYDFLQRSRAPSEFAATYPSLTLEQVYATLTYYLHNQTTVSQYLADWIAHGERLRAEQEQNPPPGLRWLQQQDTQRMRASKPKPSTTSMSEIQFLLDENIEIPIF